MSERPILFSSEMVRAILEGRKTQTRRVVKDAPGGNYKPTGLIDLSDEPHGSWHEFHDGAHEAKYVRCPYGHPGDYLWVRENFAIDGEGMICYQADKSAMNSLNENLFYLPSNYETRWKPSIHMPREICRIRLQIISVGIERLQDITEDGAIAEGVQFAEFGVAAFANLWNDLNRARGFGWDVNPWVWVIYFKASTASEVGMPVAEGGGRE